MSNENLNNNIFDAISNIMTECSVKKSLVDAGTGGKYQAFLIDNVLNEIRPLLAKNNLIMSIKHKLLESQYIEVENKYGKKTKHNVIIETALTLKHKSGAELDFQAIGEASDGGDKGISKAQTDSYKKIITQMFAISDGDDKDIDANVEDEKIKHVIKKEYQKPDVKPQVKINFEQVKQNLLGSENVTQLKENWMDTFQHKNLFTESQYKELENIKNSIKLELGI